MARYAIAFDLDTKAMADDGVTNSERTRIYQTEIPDAFACAGFTQHPQGSVYHTESLDSLAPVITLKSVLSTMAPNFLRYARAVHVFRMEDWSDVTADLKS